MWLVKSNAILTKDNLSKKGWQGDQTCSFCSTLENTEYLFFGCAMARYCWSLVSIAIGADCRLSSFSQFWVWDAKYMPHHKKDFHGRSGSHWWGFMENKKLFVLKIRNVDLLLRSSAWHHLFSLIGQDCKSPKASWS